MRNFVSAKNPAFTSSACDAILLDAVFEQIGAPIAFLAMASDSEVHGREIFDRAFAGEFGPVAAYVPPPEPPAE